VRQLAAAFYEPKLASADATSDDLLSVEREGIYLPRVVPGIELARHKNAIRAITPIIKIVTIG